MRRVPYLCGRRLCIGLSNYDVATQSSYELEERDVFPYLVHESRYIHRKGFQLTLRSHVFS